MNDHNWKIDPDIATWITCTRCGLSIYDKSQLTEADEAKNKSPCIARLRVFKLIRDEDKSGISGTGIVAQGVQFPTGKCVMEWLVAGKSMSIYDSVEVLVEIHGHEGKTRVEWVDEE